MLDGWIANQDRHHENWAALPGNDLRLAPTFDHGASLARNISDDERLERLTTKDRNRTVAHFASRAKSAFYRRPTEPRPLTTFDACSAFAAFAPQAARRWLQRLGAIDQMSIRSVLDEVPNKRMSRIAKDFTLELLGLNREHLLTQTIPS
jgi:hypothetical protein